MKNWIPIKKDYLIDNFNNLLESLSEADFSHTDDGVLMESIAKLEQVAMDLTDSFFSHNLGKLNTQDDIFIRNIRIVLAAIYSSLKTGKKPSEMIISLLDTLVINKIYHHESSIKNIKEIITELARNNSIESLPFNLKDLAEEDFDLQKFKHQLLGFKFKNDGEQKAGYESICSCLIEGSNINFNTVGLSKLSDKKLKAIVELNLDVKIRAEEKKKVNDLEFKDQVVELNRILQSLKEVKTQPRKALKTYSEDQEFFVKVTNVNITDLDQGYGFIKCKTLDPDYEPLELYLDLPNYINLNIYTSLKRSDFLEHIQDGNILKVKLIEKNGTQYFSIYSTLKPGFFDNPENFTSDYDAIFVGEFRGGTRWLTDLGHQVNIRDNDWDTEIKEAASENCGKIIVVSHLMQAQDSKGNNVINAKRVDDIYIEVDHENFKQYIPENLIHNVLDHWTEECPVYKVADEEIITFPDYYLKALGHLLSVLSEDYNLNFYERYYNAFGATLVARMLGNTGDETYSEYTLTFLRALWAFAQDTGHEWLSPTAVPADLLGMEAIEKDHCITEILSRYSTEHHYVLPSLNTGIDTSRLEKLVEASNALSGNIATSEINKIKRSITQYLGIDSIYKEEVSDKYWFGEENEMQEFKSSIVFIPSRNGEQTADPDVQIWQILKTVNGFLNSLHGGTLLIGVNDFGNASGLEQDIRWLFGKHKILAPETDKYKLYIKERIDHAFQAYKRNDTDADITSTRLRYSSSTVDGATVLRIEILPFEYGCVKMKETLVLPSKNNIKRPPFIKEAYIRASNATEELTLTKREAIESEKRKIIKDSEQQKYIILQEAIEASKYVELKNYQSYRGESDKTVMPLDLLPTRGLLVGIQKDEKDLRVFKLNRFEEVKILDKSFKKPKYNYSVDPFNMLANGKNATEIKVRFDRLGWLLLKEKHPYTDSGNYLKMDNGDRDFPYLLECPIADVKGIGAFCLSILGHFKIIDCPALSAYINTKITDYTQSHTKQQKEKD